MNYKPIPFTLDRNSRVSLTRQVEAGFKRAILSGRYVAGDVLPPREELASMLGVSSIVSREAVRRLVAQGFIVARPRIGSVVRAQDMPLWKGRVMLVGANGDGGYYQSTLGQTLRARLVSSGYLTVDAAALWIPQKGVRDATWLDPLLKEATDLAVVLSRSRAVFAHLAGEGVPFVTLSAKGAANYPQCVGQFFDDMEPATRELADACRSNGVRTVLDVRTWTGNAFAGTQFRRAGIAVEEWKINVDLPDDGFFIENIQRAALEAFEARLSSEGTRWLPDLLFFSDDDHLAAGALSALLRHGVDVPGDVRVATLANRGLGPVFHRSLARLELNPVAHGNVIADYVLAKLDGKPPPSVPKLPISFFPGETLGTGGISPAPDLGKRR